MKNAFLCDAVFFIEGRGVMAAGKLSQGALKLGMKSSINGKMAEVVGIESQRQSVELLSGDVPAALILSGVSREDVKSGSEYYFE